MENEHPHSKKQYSFKILVIGDPGTGKTSLIRRFVHNVYTANYKATIGVDFALKIVPIDENRVAHLQMWDISGQDRYGVMTRVYYKDAHAAVIVMDLTRDRTIEGALRWKQDLDNKVVLADGSPVPAVLVANKCDMDNNVSDDRLAELERENGFIDTFRTSAKENTGIQETFQRLIHEILATESTGQYEIPFSNRDSNVRLGETERKTTTKDNGCC